LAQSETLEKELAKIESTFLEERSELLEANKKEMNALFDKRREWE
jgi:hypothetical protein